MCGLESIGSRCNPKRGARKENWRCKRGRCERLALQCQSCSSRRTTSEEVGSKYSTEYTQFGRFLDRCLVEEAVDRRISKALRIGEMQKLPRMEAGVAMTRYRSRSFRARHWLRQNAEKGHTLGLVIRALFGDAVALHRAGVRSHPSPEPRARPSRTRVRVLSLAEV